MTLRVLLVGLVASLGLALPSAERLESWASSWGVWLNSRVVAWTVSDPADESAIVVITDAPAETPSSLTSGTSASTGRLDLNAAPAQTAVSVPTVLKATGSVTEGEERDGEAVLETWLAALMAPDLAGSEAPEVVAESDEPPAWLRLDLAEWAGTMVMAEAAFVITDEAVATVPKALSATPADPDRVFANVVEEMAAAFARDNASARAAAAPMAGKVPAYEPLEPGDDLYPGVAYALNREAEGIGVSAPAGPTPAVVSAPAAPTAPALSPAAEPSDSGDTRLIHALRLTREAVNAWSSLLHGPAIVTIAR